MKYSTAAIARISLIALFFLLSSCPLYAQQADEKQAAAETPQKAETVPSLAEIIPMESDLQGQLVRLENEIKALAEVSSVQKKYGEYEEIVNEMARRFQNIKKSGGRKWPRLATLSKELSYESALFEKVDKPLTRSISQLEDWKKDWLAEKKRWQKWTDTLGKGDVPLQLKTTFARAQGTIDKALKHIVKQMDTLLKDQEEGRAVWVKLDSLDAEIGAAIKEERRDYLSTGSPPMFTPTYFSEFRSQFSETIQEGIDLSWPSKRFYMGYGWLLVVQFLVLLAMLASIYIKRQALLDSEHWRFLPLRPFSSSFFLIVLVQLFFPNSQSVPITLQLPMIIIGGISFVRILGCTTDVFWKREAVIFVVILFVVTQIVTSISLPVPLYRLYTLVAGIIALFYLVRWSREARKEAIFIIRLFLLAGLLLCCAIIISQFWGNDDLAAYLFESALTSMTLILAFAFFMYLVRGGLHWIFINPPVWNFKQLRSEADDLVKRFSFLVEALIMGFVILPLILTAWGLYSGVPEAISGLLSLGFNIGSIRVSLDMVIATLGTLYGSFLFSWIIPKIILDEKLAGENMERGVRISVARLIQYFIVFIGILVTFSVLGLDLTKLTILLSALGVGVGFGLQGIVNNFLSGIIMLFERPVRIGDTIELNGQYVHVKSIGLRSTTVQTFDEAEMIIPNADLISNQVINWTLSNRQARLILKVGVAYGSDIPLVIETLLTSAGQHEKISTTPEPHVLFQQFGDSSLDFELRVFVSDIDHRVSIASELHQIIDRNFREAKIQIPFPQRDVHLDSVDNSVQVPDSNDDAGEKKASDGKEPEAAGT